MDYIHYKNFYWWTKAKKQFKNQKQFLFFSIQLFKLIQSLYNIQQHNCITVLSMKFLVFAPLFFISTLSQFDAIGNIARDSNSFISKEVNNVQNIATHIEQQIQHKTAQLGETMEKTTKELEGTISNIGKASQSKTFGEFNGRVQQKHNQVIPQDQLSTQIKEIKRIQRKNQIIELFTEQERYELKKMHEEYKLKKQEAIQKRDQQALKNIQKQMHQKRIKFKKLIDERLTTKQQNEYQIIDQITIQGEKVIFTQRPKKTIHGKTQERQQIKQKLLNIQKMNPEDRFKAKQQFKREREQKNIHKIQHQEISEKKSQNFSRSDKVQNFGKKRRSIQQNQQLSSKQFKHKRREIRQQNSEKIQQKK